jgi:hypothetical protein
VTSRDWLAVTFQLSGGLDATLRYEAEAAGWERIWVNGRLVVDTGSNPAKLRSQCLEFSLPAAGGVGIPASLEFRDGRLFDGLALQLRVDGAVVYQDRSFARLDREARVRKLPLPASSPGQSVESLPVPGGPGETSASVE